jgi:hypothetical protein
VDTIGGLLFSVCLLPSWDVGQGGARLGFSRSAQLALGTSFLALVLRLVTASAGFSTSDEPGWMVRSWRFQDALLHGNFGSASARHEYVATMPGVTTMWIGGVARVVWVAGRRIGLWADTEGAQFLSSPSALTVARFVMAVAIAALVGLTTLLVAKWAGLGAAAVAGVLVGTEPFLVAHGAVLHTDELGAILGIDALLATALVLGVPHRTGWAGRRWVAVAAGALWSGSWLTKVSAVVFLPPVVLLVGWAVIASLRRTSVSHERRQEIAAIVRLAGWWVAAAVVTAVVSYPALWVAPIEELGFVGGSAGLAGIGHQQFFFGEITETPGPAFYLVALPLRMTPWFFVAALVAAVAIWWRRETRGFGVVAACMAGPPLVVLSLSAKQFDRYGLAILLVATLLVGVVVASGADVLRQASSVGRHVGLAGVLAAVLVGIHSLAVAPWGLGYFNPALGGADVAQDTVLVGWGEGMEQAALFIDQREDRPCEEVTVAALPHLSCGRRVNWFENPQYLVIYVSERQRMEPAMREWYIRDRELVGTVERLGITYVEIFGPRAE